MREAAWWSVLQGNPSTPIRIATCACEWKRGLAANPLSRIRPHVNTPLASTPAAITIARPHCVNRDIAYSYYLDKGMQYIALTTAYA